MMSFGICKLNCVAIRSDSSHSAEMVSQLLFGETFKTIEKDGNWINIKVDFDQQTGWVAENQIQLLKEDDYLAVTNSNQTVSHEIVSIIVSNNNNDLITITLGASLPDYQDGKFYIANTAFCFDGNIIQNKLGKAHIVKTAFLLLNTPFLWGGRTPFGIDSSGFTQLVYKINGYKLYRKAEQQASQGEVLSFIEESTPGDLAFFDNQEGKIIHVGIILSNNYIIHCQEKVRIDRLDQSGIYNADINRHTFKLRVIKNIF